MTYNGTITTTDPQLVDKLDDMPEGYAAFILYDDSAYMDSPRDWGTVATLINRNDRLIDIDADDANVGQAREHYARYRHDGSLDWREHLTRRYLAIFRPDVVHYRESWSYGREGYGWGYVTRESMQAAGFSDAEITEELASKILDAELDVYGQWAEGQVYGVIVTRDSDGAEASLWGVYDSGHDWPYVRADVIPELIHEIESA